jgi:hypothetical protein
MKNSQMTLYSSSAVVLDDFFDRLSRIIVTGPSFSKKNNKNSVVKFLKNNLSNNDWIELVELHKKKMFYKNQHFGSIPLIFEDKDILDSFCKIGFFMQLDELYPTSTKKGLDT